jgi:hypothetical protein
VTLNARYGLGMDHLWAASQLRVFVMKIDQLEKAALSDGIVTSTEPEAGREHAARLADEVLTLDPVMRDVMNAARPGFGDYPTTKDASVDHRSVTYWTGEVKPWALRAQGVHELWAESHERLRPDSPDLVADQFHPNVWEAAAPLWRTGIMQEAVHAAARSVSAALKWKLRRYNVTDTALCHDAFSPNDPTFDHPRLRLPGDKTDDTWRSRQQGALEFGAGCFMAIRNPAAHEYGLELSEQEALEQLAALSVLARWIDECELDVMEDGEVVRRPGHWFTG